MSEYLLYSPLVIERPRAKNLALNLNEYRNMHYQTLNGMKRKYKDLMASAIMRLPVLNKICIQYTLYPKTRRLCDVSNVCSVIDKFFSDAIVEFGRIPDDNYTFLPSVSYHFGEVDKDNPRVEILIKEIQ